MPAVDDGQWLRMQFPTDDMTAGSQGGRPVAVIVLQDGTELHFFQFIEFDDESSVNEERYTVRNVQHAVAYRSRLTVVTMLYRAYWVGQKTRPHCIFANI